MTLPSDYLSGRFTLGFYKKMNIMDPIVYNENDYIKKTIQYLSNDEKRKSIEDEIKKNKHMLFNDKESVVEWQNMLIDLYQKNK